MKEFGVKGAFSRAVGCAILDDAGAAKIGVTWAAAIEHFLFGLEAYRAEYLLVFLLFLEEVGFKYDWFMTHYNYISLHYKLFVFSK